MPNYFLEYDVFDRDENIFLSTSERQHFFSGLTFITSVRVIDVFDDSNVLSLTKLKSLIGKSAFISETAFELLDANELPETDLTGLMEGLYLKLEDDNQVHQRFKLVRPEFIERIIDSGSHWKRRILKTNLLLTSTLE